MKTMLWLTYSAAIITLSVYHEPWMDELIAWDIAVSNTPAGVFDIMASEGHFCIWHFMLYPFAQAGMTSLIGLSIVSCTTMIAAAWLLIYRSPFGVWSSLFILASYPALYTFPVISRVYALIPLALWLVAIYHSRRMERPVTYGLTLGLLINTHIYMEGLALALLLWWIVEAYYLDKGRRKKVWGGIALTMALGVFALSQIVGNLFIESSPAGTAAEETTVWIDGNVQAILPVLNAVPWLRSNTLALNVAGMAVLAGLFAWYCWMLRRHPVLLGVVIAGILFQIAFALLVYNGLYQRRYLIYFTLIFGLWVAGSRGRIATLWLLVLLLGSLPLSLRDIPFDLRYRYSDESQINMILRNYNHESRFICMDDRNMHNLTNCFGKPKLEMIQYSDEAKLLERITTQLPDSFLLCKLYGPNENQAYSSHSELSKYMSDLGYNIYETQRYRVYSGLIYITDFHRKASNNDQSCE